MSIVTAFFSGLLFACGLVVSGMAMPSKVMGFLDVTGEWDPSLAFVMGAALLVYAPLFRVIIKRSRPVVAPAFELPTARQVDARLLVGAALFGIGWGAGGMCPGPGIVVAGALLPGGIVFFVAMMAGAAAFRALDGWRSPQTMNKQ